MSQASWCQDGPMLPIEFARKSKGGRLTLVIYPGVKKVPVLWAEMQQSELYDAIETLRKREGTSETNIGYISGGKHRTQFSMILDPLKAWVKKHQFDALVWTDLKPKFENYSERAVLEYLQKEANKSACREYIFKAPAQIDTEMRKFIVSSGILEL